MSYLARSIALVLSMAIVAVSARAEDRATSYTKLSTDSADNSARASNSHTVYFGVDVVPILTKYGCNSGGCHGKATGQNGFAISLLGFEPELDYEALVSASRGRRIDTAAPDQSLVLLKATGQVPHGGGRRFDVDSDDYRVLRQWIARGAAPARDSDPVVERIEIEPRIPTLPMGANQQLKVTAFLSDGTTCDVTHRAVYQSNEPEIASVDADGLVATVGHRGLVSVMARFGQQIASFHTAVPFTSADRSKHEEISSQLDELESLLGDSKFDQLLLHQWRKLGIVPSPVADDATFLRRAFIDICGTLPSPEETKSFLSDQRPDKDRRLVDRLLERPEYATYFALKWGDILQNRGAGYSTSKQRPGTTLFANWIRDSIAFNKPYDQFVAEIITATGSQNEYPPTIWYRSVRRSSEYVESVAQAFLGVRVQCAQCHHHPAERWSQADYYGLAAVFARVGRKGGFADAEVPTNEIIYTKDSGEVLHPRTGQVVRPRPLGGDELEPHVDPRVALARWMTSPKNPFFARTMVNRMWAHFLGRGIVHPIDDSRSTNPPSHPELLDALADEFIASRYDVKHLIRLIANCRAYRLSSHPTSWNADDTQTFARFYPRRLTAEVLLDGISQVLNVPTEYSGGSGKFPLGTRAIELPDENVPAHFLDVFGRPARMSACECERVDAPSLTQALELVNSTEIQRKLTMESGFARQLASSNQTVDKLSEEMFLQILARPPSSREVQTVDTLMKSETDRAEACRSLVWSLLATNEFLFNH